jgi:AraC-like DNA-binding protein
MAGWRDLICSHLTRRFKRVVGVPPGQYAKTYGSTRAGETRVA